MTTITRNRLSGQRSSLAVKAPCRLATTANITLAGAQSIDGVAVAEGDRILVKNQTTASENGIYEVRLLETTWSRAGDWESNSDAVQGTRVLVVQGDTGPGVWQLTTSGTIVIGTTSLSFTHLGSSSAYTSNRTTLKAIDPNAVASAYLLESGREGLFIWQSGDYSTQVAADTQEGVYIAATDTASSSGAWVRELDGSLQVEWFGASAYTQAELETLNGAAAVATQAATNSTAFQAAVDMAETLGGYDVMALGQIYVLDTRLEMPQGVILVGRGTDEWEPVYPSRPKLWACTTLLFKGTGTADITFDGITSMRNAGGWPEDPDNPGSYFKLFSAYNADASGTTAATQRTFSAAIASKNGDKYWGLKHLRVVNWCGTNGIEGFSDTGSPSLGDDWDIGVLLLDAEYVTINDVQVVGGWREFALLDVSEIGNQASSERNRVENCKLQGRVGLGLRSADRWEVNATTVNSVTVTWSEEHYFSTGGGSFRGSDNADYTYTGLSFSSPNLTLTGVSPDPSGIFHLRHTGTGFANTQFVNCYVYDLWHQSGNDAATLGLSDSKCLEMSGFPLRGVSFENCKFHGPEPVLAQIHDAFDVRMWGCQYEGGGHFIAAPVTTASTATAPAGETRALFIDGDDGLSDQDLRLFLPRTAFVQSIQVAPEDDLTGDFVLTPLRSGQDLILRPQASGTITMDGGVVFSNAVAATEADLSDHLALYGTTYGFSITNNNINLVANGNNTLSSTQNNLTSKVNHNFNAGAAITGGLTADVIDNEQTLTITPYMTAFDLVTDQSAGLKQAFIDFFDGNYQTLDLEGQVIILDTDIVLRCGSDGFTSNPNFLRNSEKRICNGKIVWTGAASGSSTTDYMIDIGCPQSVIGEAAFLNLVWDNVVFDGNGTSKNLFRFFNFYNMMFDQCHFLDYDEAIAVFLSSTDDSANYVDDNGAIFHNCRWADLSVSDGLTGTPILAYCGDIVIDGGWAEWSGPFDFHIGSITISNFHWSYGPYSGQTESRRGAIFRDPRGITLVNNDCDYANFYLTNAGYFGGTTHNGETNWRGIYIAGNKYTANYAPPTGEGIITFETTVASTQIANVYIAVGGITFGGAVSDNSVDFLRVISSGSGSYSTTNGIYVYNDYFGLKPGGDAFAPASGSTGNRTYIANDAIDITGAINVAGATFGSNVASAANDLSDHIALYGTTYGLSVTSGNLNLVAAGANSFSVRVGSVESYKQLNVGEALRLAKAYTIATLPGSPTVGMIARVTDGDAALTHGQTAVNSGAGATPYLVWYNGSNWTVIGV